MTAKITLNLLFEPTMVDMYIHDFDMEAAILLYFACKMKSKKYLKQGLDDLDFEIKLWRYPKEVGKKVNKQYLPLKYIGTSHG